ncbi:OmpA family protein [Defluviimonas sp. WL0050]|uniref:OmpA family protein n=1 Tax=Albidovulum litorale TaxID=2984134 RepID=A0ABT2ZLV9_9RHOB|nr:OmpA family protein [Defluviimonas sp. WL0050]MCV2872117.1 OmpA family protein [Defluviimonas sp. WL0050]
MKRLAIALLLAAPAAHAAPTLSLPPSAARTVEDSTRMGSYALPIGPWENGRIETVATEGEVTQTAWRIREGDLSTMAVLKHLREQLRGEGFEVLFECDTDACGGFDFRFGTPVLPEPEMHVDLGDFRFLSARRVAGPEPDYVSLMVSRSADSGFVQMVRVGAALSEPVPIAKANFTARAAVPGPSAVDDELTTAGKVVLDDLDFGSGSTDLGEGRFASLAALAAFLKANPDKTVALVGHTDAEGSLAGNVALSRKRAQSVLERLVALHGVDPNQLSADGVGFLSPIASNLTPEGRTQNRRVEAMITSTQ